MKTQPEKTKFFLRKVQFLGNVVSKNGIQPVKKRVTDLKSLKSPENKRDVMRVLGCLGFYSRFIKKLHVDCKPFYDLTRTENNLVWKAEHEKLFNDIKNRITEDTILAIPDTKHPFHVHIDVSSIEVGSTLIQDISEGIPQKLVYDKGSACLNQDFASYIHELGITPAPRTAHAPWTNGKVDIQNKHLGAHFKFFLENARGKWDEPGTKICFFS